MTYEEALKYIHSVNWVGSKLGLERTQELLRVTLSPGNDRKAKPIPSTVYLMNHIGCKAILVECGFLTNPEEDRLLQTPDYQLKLAATLAGAYLQESARTGPM